jgi:hypothetical protein
MVMNENVKLPATSSRNSGRTYAQRWLAQMTPDEALTAANRMMSAYSEFSPCNREYLMSLADALCQFPMEVATAACSPVHGVPKGQKNFRPNVGQVTEWCEREAAFLYRMAEREGLLRRDSHKTYTGTLINSSDYQAFTKLNAKGIADSNKTYSETFQPKYTTEERCAHVERLRAQGRLTFDTGPEAERRKPWFDRLTKEAAEKILADYEHAARPFEAPALEPVPF